MLPSLPPAGLGLLAAAGLTLASALGQTAVRVDVADPAPNAVRIPGDFAGLSFEMKDVLADKAGGHLFRSDNTALLATFRTLGVTSLRIGGNTTDTPSVPVPTPADLDNAFGFIREAHLRTLFTLRLRKGDPSAAAAVAKYVMEHYAPQVAALAIGNEPNVYDKTYPKYLADLHTYLDAVLAVAPGAKFCAPGTTPAKADWVRSLAADTKDDPRIILITQHEYPGGNARSVTDPAAARDRMLSPRWIALYEKIYASFAPAVAAAGKPFRLEETNSFYNGGAKDVSDTFAAALWGLDYLHWWAAHGAVGVNFHTGDHVAAADSLTPCRYAAFWTAPDGYAVHPIGYALKAFALGGTGLSLPVSIRAKDGTADSQPVSPRVESGAGASQPVSPRAEGAALNLTAYAIRHADGSLAVTLINKGHGADAPVAQVTLRPSRRYASAAGIWLEAPGDIAATTGLTIGGASIGDDATWKGNWETLSHPDPTGAVAVAVPPASAVVVRLTSD